MGLLVHAVFRMDYPVLGYEHIRRAVIVQRGLTTFNTESSNNNKSVGTPESCLWIAMYHEAL